MEGIARPGFEPGSKGPEPSMHSLMRLFTHRRII